MEMIDDFGDVAELEGKHLCAACIGETYLQAEVSRDGEPAECSYCGGTARAYSLAVLADCIGQAFERHYTRTATEPDSVEQSLLGDRELEYNWSRHGMPVVEAIEYAAGIPEEAAADVQRILADRHANLDAYQMGDECEFDSESHYEEKEQTDVLWQLEWQEFERLLKTESRFFSAGAEAVLNSVFEGLDSLSTDKRKPLLVRAGPATRLKSVYRARVFLSEDKLQEALVRPDLSLGPPPSGCACDGRMNARGVTVFYGATNASVTIAEVRPPVGSRVLVGRFDIVRPLRLLDLTALEGVTQRGSIFDPSFAAALERAVFLRSLTARMTRPIMPGDEALDYLPTQAIADFLATRTNAPLDGIIFPSVQSARSGKNIVLFHRSSRVREMELPAGTKLEPHAWQVGDEGWKISYGVTETVPSEVPPQPVRKGKGLGMLDDLLESARDPLSSDLRSPALVVDTESIYVYHVRAVDFRTEAERVSRHRVIAVNAKRSS
ncbi:RES family NAD+ phosphorylase [Paraburkholderia sp. BR10872]|uniref:RES family NAD+ phosphorylase n=1 Tax=Paraburkholderia sp. BR10872 TaxID=3236989 RepID=UPI0034D30169